jgi:hypothetical protein
MEESNVAGSGPESAEAPASPASRWPRLATAACILLLILQPIVFFRGVLIYPSEHIPFDLAGFHLPLISHAAQCVRGGIAPFWDPYQYCGAPIHADIQAQTFYPPAWPAMLLGNAGGGRKLFYWVEWMIPLHMMAAGLFAFWLIRRMGLRHPAALLGATVYQVGAYFASQAQHLGAICAAAWLPLALLAVFEMRRGWRARWVAALGIAVAMSILAGFVATTEATALAVTLFLLALWILREGSWRMIPAVAAGFALGAAISAVELVPMLMLSRVSMASIRSQWFAGAGGLPVQTLASLVSPNYYHIFDLENYKLPDNFTYLYAYCGLAPLALLAAAPFLGKARARAFLILTALSGVVMLGGNVPGFDFFFARLPGMIRGSFYVEHALMAFTCFAGITAAVVLDRLGRRLPEAALWAAALITAADLIHTGNGKPMNAYEGGYKTVETESGVPERPHITGRLRTLAGATNPPTRVDYADDVFSQGLRGSELLRIPTASGDNPFVLLRVLYLRRVYCGGNPWNRNLPVKNLASPLLSMTNVEWIAAGAALPEDQVRAARLEPLDPVDGMHIYRNPRVLPRFFLAARLKRSAGAGESLGFLSRADFDPADEAVVEGIAADRAGLGSGEVKVRRYSPNRVELQASASAPAFLVTSEVMYPGWQARVNGAPAPLLMTNGAFRGLDLPAGASEIVMEYHPRFFWPCAALSLAALAFAAAAAAGLVNFRRAR